MKASRPLSLRSFVIVSESLTSFSMLFDALSVPSSPVDILRVRALSLTCPWFQSVDSPIEATNSVISVLRNLQRHTLEHLSLNVMVPLDELSSYTLTERLKSLRVSSWFLPACISWLTRTLECGSFPELTAITIDIHISMMPRVLILEDGDKDAWRAFGTVLRKTSHVEILQTICRQLHQLSNPRRLRGASGR
ncbi:hypothetical protein BDZ89DRAFT_371352 [Hymenopellis radicata]|nr:hypothetical protein BDZ89DRAFT_371352 [Hymenopellis radicata]